MNDMPLSMLFSILALMLVLSAFFSGSETALMTLNRYRLRHLVKLKHAGAIKAHRLLQRPDRLLGLILLGNQFANIFAASVTTVIAIRLYPEEESSIAIGAGILTIAMLIFSEVTPKTLAAIKPELLAFPAAWIYTGLLKVFYPIVGFVNLFVNLLLRLGGIDVKENGHDTQLSKDELKSIITEAESLMPVRYQKMLLGILDLESATVEDIMTPRNEIVGIDLEQPIESIVMQIKTSPHTQLAVYKKNIDRIVGFLHLRKVLMLINQDNFDKNTIMGLLSKPVFIPESTPVHTQMLNFKTEKSHIGLVVDEYGDVQGLVTLDDLLQEIVGELLTDDNTARKQSDGSYLVDANITVRELNRVTQWSLPTEGPKTLNGLIIEFMETIPELGTSIKLHGHPLEIIKRDENTVKLVKFLPKK
ncbi:MAG: HlyC/CorC family transporter [Methylococcales bacterium]|nr:HlyC/CorC family transporter [Methylococcales bacterium]